MRKKRVDKLEKTILQDTKINTIVLWSDNLFFYNGKEYNSKQQLEKDYPNSSFNFISICWE